MEANHRFIFNSEWFLTLTLVPQDNRILEFIKFQDLSSSLRLLLGVSSPRLCWLRILSLQSLTVQSLPTFQDPSHTSHTQSNSEDLSTAPTYFQFTFSKIVLYILLFSCGVQNHIVLEDSNFSDRYLGVTIPLQHRFQSPSTTQAYQRHLPWFLCF